MPTEIPHEPERSSSASDKKDRSESVAKNISGSPARHLVGSTILPRNYNAEDLLHGVNSLLEQHGLRIFQTGLSLEIAEYVEPDEFDEEESSSLLLEPVKKPTRKETVIPDKALVPRTQEVMASPGTSASLTESGEKTQLTQVQKILDHYGVSSKSPDSEPVLRRLIRYTETQIEIAILLARKNGREPRSLYVEEVMSRIGQAPDESGFLRYLRYIQNEPGL